MVNFGSDDETPGYVHFKIGRSNNIARRLREWNKQCSAHEQVLRGTWPPNPQASKLRGRIGSANDVVPYVHRLETLVHIEVADRALRANNPGLTSESMRKSKFNTSMYMAGKRCECG